MIEVIDQQFSSINILERAIYKECTFENCDLSKQNLNSFQFIDCAFIGCNLSNSDISQASFKTVSFESCKLMGIQFQQANPFLFKVVFEACNLSLSSFYSMNINKTQFIDCDLSEVDFTETELKESDFSGSTLSQTIFEKTNLSKSDFRTAENFRINPSENNIKKAKFSKENLAGLLADFDIIISQ